MLDRMLGLKPGEQPNEQEKVLIDKRTKIEKEYMLEQVFSGMNAEGKEDSENEDPIQKRNKEFIMENFFKVYDRPPLSS